MTVPICSTICGDSLVGGAAVVYSATKISNAVPFAAPIIETTVPFDSVVFDVGPAITPDLPNLVINEDGFYEITATQSWIGDSTDTMTIVVNDATVQNDSAENPGFRAGSLSVLLELSAGDVVRLIAGSSDGDLLTATLSAEKRN